MLSAILTGLSYPGLSRAWAWRIAAIARFLTLVGALALLLDVPVGPPQRVDPLVALDVSASWQRARADTAFEAARSAAARAAGRDTLWLWGASLRPAVGTVVPSDARSRLGPLVDRTLGTGRPVHLFTDGELDDPERLAALPAGSIVDVRPAPPLPDLAVRGLEAPAAVVAGDSLEIVVRLLAGGAGARAATMQITLDGEPLRTLDVPALDAWGEHELRAVVSPAAVGPAQRILRAAVRAPGDAEPRNDTLAAVLEVSRVPLGVAVSTAPDQDLRYALAVLRGTVGIPVRTYLRVAPGQWRVEPGLARITESAVREAVAAAPFVVLHGDTAIFGAPRAVTRGALTLIPALPAAASDEWYVAATPRSPLSLGESGVAWDSLPPLELAASPTGQWTALTARGARSAEIRAAIVGDDAPRRVITMAAAGTWRWAVRGAALADAHRSLWGAVFEHAAARGDERRAVGLAASVVRAGEPLRWRRGTTADSLVRGVLRALPDGREDSLTVRFDAGQREAVSDALEAGEYELRIAGETQRIVVSRAAEWLPRRAPTLPRPAAALPPAPSGHTARDLWWLYVSVVLTLCVEWIARRQHGLR